MNISPIEVYFILQLDSIRNAIVALLIIIGLPTVISAVIFFLSFDACFESDGTVRALTKNYVQCHLVCSSYSFLFRHSFHLQSRWQPCSYFHKL